MALGVYDKGSSLRGFTKALEDKDGVALLLAISEYLLFGTGMGIVLSGVRDLLFGVTDLLGSTLNEFSVLVYVYLLDGVRILFVFTRKSPSVES